MNLSHTQAQAGNIVPAIAITQASSGMAKADQSCTWFGTACDSGAAIRTTVVTPNTVGAGYRFARNGRFIQCFGHGHTQMDTVLGCRSTAQITTAAIRQKIAGG
jgi:hypothetical protein